MGSIKLTHRTIDSYQLRDKQKDYTDTTHGLILRVSKTKKVFYFRYRDSKGKSKRKKIGEYPTMSLKSAREVATEYYLNIQKDIYPEDRQDELNSPLPKLNEVYQNHKENNLKHSLAKSSYSTNTSIIEKNIIPVFGSREIESISRREISEFLQENFKKYSTSHTRKFRQLLSQIFEHAKTYAEDVENPVKDAWNVPTKPKPRERYYTKVEIRNLFTHLDFTTQPFKSLVQLLFYTGKRKTETLKMTWNQINFESQIWTIPKENTKNRKGDKVYLCNTIMDDVIKPRFETEGKKSKYVFHSNWKSHYHTYPTTFKPQLKHLQNNSGVQDFTFHDLRRTIATHLSSEYKIYGEIIDHILNNASVNEYNTLRKTYNLNDFHSEKIEALKKYESFINEIRSDK